MKQARSAYPPPSHGTVVNDWPSRIRAWMLPCTLVIHAVRGLSSQSWAIMILTRNGGYFRFERRSKDTAALPLCQFLRGFCTNAGVPHIDMRTYHTYSHVT